MKNFLALCLICCAWLLPAAPVQLKGSAVLATVNGEVITLGDVLRESSSSEAAAHVYAGENLSAEILRLRKDAVDRLIERKLLISEFKRLNLSLPPRYVESMLDDMAFNLGCKSRSELAAKARLLNTSLEELKLKAAERLMAEMVIGREFYGAINPTPQELYEYFQKNQEKYSRPGRIKLALLLLPDNTSEQVVKEVGRKLQAAPAEFPEMVKAFSCGPNREQGGEVGFIEQKNLRSEFAAVLKPEKLAANKIYGPVKTPEGQYFLKILELDGGQKAEFAKVRGQIREAMEKAARSQALAELYKRLRSSATINYYFGHAAAADKTAADSNSSVKTAPAGKAVEKNIKKMEKKTMVTLKTNHGDIKLELFADAAPKTVANFLEYVKSGFYNGTLFHRVINDFMIQGGGFDTKFKQKETRAPIQNEADNRLSNEIGTIAMARTMDPHSATAQFFINVANNDFLDFRSPSPQFYGYCVFGKVVEGMDVVNKIKTVKTGGRAGHQDVPKEDVIILEAVVEE
ncbi:MAG: hypothetical protein E7052_00605 [Lentisphaerae bacterium]|nr:hypothetical protein [Lentisphaerota bacterium]